MITFGVYGTTIKRIIGIPYSQEAGALLKSLGTQPFYLEELAP